MINFDIAHGSTFLCTETKRASCGSVGPSLIR